MADHPDILQRWYNEHRRLLPWRETRDPYRIWVSEIILQQTRISQGTTYYYAFLSRFPDVSALAASSIDDVLLVWEGLGYYRRALNMHKAAIIVTEIFSGHFPSSYHDLITLPGIGDYTASAISSICAGEVRPAIDGNVKRFISRLGNILHHPDSPEGKDEIRQYALQMIASRDPGEMNQAMMEFGALQCIAGTPDCSLCPFHDCLALQHNTVQFIPVRKEKKDLRKRYFNYFVFSWPEKDTLMFLVKKRQENDIWAGLHDFPCHETEVPVQDTEALLDTAGSWCNIPENGYTYFRSIPYSHMLTHQILHTVFHLIRLNKEPERIHQQLQKVTLHAFNRMAKPQLIRRYIEDTLTTLR